VAFLPWWVFNFPIFLSGCLLFDVTIEVGMCESVSTHLICSRSKLTTREMAINDLFPNNFCHFLTKKLGNFHRLLFLSCASVISHNQCNYLTNLAIFWEIAKSAISQNWGFPGGRQ